MNANAEALPRSRTRRKRRKPMPPWLTFLLFSVILNGVGLAIAVLGFGLGWSVGVNAVIAAANSLCLCRNWPMFKREWDRWRRDDEPGP